MEEDYEVETADSGQKALEILRSTSPISCVVSDMRMPIMDGVELVQKIASEWPEIPCIILTGNQDEESERRAIDEANVFCLMNKPSPRGEIIEAIERALSCRDAKEFPAQADAQFTVTV
ncbi:protein containing Signal transduction response regulator, receiver region domain protein [Rhodopirellula europaea 6C]|uniref:Protein containing Signal transduction response regulator, receiver region domain protein n=2 Tax=Rhodopirellula TaxID=265488 RepID=M2APZ4_9BACT|nr:protein containing Signal transduction response regulator, receiver region domain protein [Rhodopirellula europaea 6C]